MRLARNTISMNLIVFVVVPGGYNSMNMYAFVYTITLHKISYSIPAFNVLFLYLKTFDSILREPNNCVTLVIRESNLRKIQKFSNN